jgi:signal transduction histidine kinase
VSSGIRDVLSGELAVSPAYLQRGLDAASRWAAAHQAARWLRALMAKLMRLSVLDRSLCEAVEAEKIAAMAEFAAGAGHEINNPLAVIAGRAQLLLRDEADPERRRDLALMNAQAMRVHEMIADLRLFATPPELERQPLDLAALVRRLIDEMQPLAARQETTICLVEGSSAVRIEADPVQLTVAIRSLCQNALDALGHRGQIEIAVNSDGDEALIAVADDGPGILPEQRPHIFEPFYSARQAGRGVGMGLSKCWRIVTQHRGRIDLASRVGSGAVFTIRLPLGKRESR